MTRFAPWQPDASGAPLDGVALRAATPADAAALARIQASRGGDPARSALKFGGELRAIAAGRAPRYLCVAERQGVAIGYGRCGLQDWPDGVEMPDGWYLIGVTIDPAWRRRGVGRALTAHRLDWIRERAGVAWYYATVVNRASIALHAGFGFVEVARGIEIPGAKFTGGVGALFRAEL